MAAEIEEVFKSKNGSKITKVINEDNDTILVESFVNDSEEMVYNLYEYKDGGNIELISDEEIESCPNSEDLDDCDEDELNDSIVNIRSLYDRALEALINDL